MSTKMATIPMSNIFKNPYRDFNMAVLREETIASLCESINDTDFWQNFPVRLMNNTLADGRVITSQAEIEALFDGEHDWSLEAFEIPHGHHRLEALKRLEWSEVSLLVKYISDETMLKMMANENKGGYGSNVGVICETVLKVSNELNKQLEECAVFKEYKGELFKTKKAFDEAKAGGIGFRKVREYLGQTWSESDIRGAFKILKLVDKDYFTQEDVGNVASMGLLETVGAIAEFMYEGKDEVPAPNYPTYWKRQIMNDVIDRCSADNTGYMKVTVAQLRNARTYFEKDGVNPANFLKTGNTKAVFEVTKATKELLFDPDKTEEVNYAAVDALSETDGFQDFADLKALQEAIKKSMKASFARLAKGEADVEEELSATTESALQDALDSEASGDVVVPDLFPEVPENGADIIPLPTGRIVETYIQTSVHLGHGAQLIIRDIDNVGENANLDMAIKDLLTNTLQLALKRLSRDAVVAIFQKNS